MNGHKFHDRIVHRPIIRTDPPPIEHKFYDDLTIVTVPELVQAKSHENFWHELGRQGAFKNRKLTKNAKDTTPRTLSDNNYLSVGVFL